MVLGYKLAPLSHPTACPEQHLHEPTSRPGLGTACWGREQKASSQNKDLFCYSVMASMAGRLYMGWETLSHRHSCCWALTSMLTGVLYIASHYQNFLNFILVTLHVVEHHILGDIFPVLQFVHLIICICVEYWPAQKLCQGLGEEEKEKQWSNQSVCFLWPQKDNAV